MCPVEINLDMAMAEHTNTSDLSKEQSQLLYS